MQEDEYLTTAEAAAIVRRPGSTLAYWRYMGEGPPFAKIGKRVLYRRVDVEEWLARQFTRRGQRDEWKQR